MAAGARTLPCDVFVNCPFDDAYAETFRALIFAILACGFRPRSSRETDDDGQARIEKLYEIIRSCRYGIHDISRTELDSKHRLPRFNMPLELGIFLGAKRYGPNSQREKRVLVFDKEQYRYQKYISDLAGMDIHAHAGEPETAITETRNWLTNVSRRHLLGGKAIIKLYKRFLKALPALANELDLNPKSISYADFLQITAGWLMEAKPKG